MGKISESKMRRHDRMLAHLSKATGPARIAPNPRKQARVENSERRRLVKRLFHRGAWKGTPQGNTTIDCPTCSDRRDAEIRGSGWKQCKTCGVKVR